MNKNIKDMAVKIVKEEEPFCSYKGQKKTKDMIRNFNKRVKEVCEEIEEEQLLVPEIPPVMIKELRDQHGTNKGMEFEEIVKNIFEELGYKVLHPDYVLKQLGIKKPTDMTSGDFGIDLIAIDPETNLRIGIQCKCINSKNLSSNVVSHTQAGLNVYKCNQGLIISTAESVSSASVMLAQYQPLPTDFISFNEIDTLYKNYLINKEYKKEVLLNKIKSKKIIKG